MMRVRDYNGPWAVKTVDCCKGGSGYGGALCRADRHRRNVLDRRRVRRVAKLVLNRDLIGGNDGVMA
jgi:hypothetical protein